MKKDKGGPAFPGFVFHDQFNEDHGKYEPIILAVGGMTLRQWYTGMALQGLIDGCLSGNNSGWTVQGNVVAALQYADALIEAEQAEKE